MNNKPTIPLYSRHCLSFIEVSFGGRLWRHIRVNSEFFAANIVIYQCTLVVRIFHPSLQLVSENGTSYDLFLIRQILTKFKFKD